MRLLSWLSISLTLVLGCGDAENICEDGENNPAELCFNGAGSFAAGERTFSVATGDVNRDGFVDLVTADRDENTVSVFLGQASGLFLRQTPLNVSSPPVTDISSQPSSVVLADLNKDGALDIAVASSGENADINPDDVSVFLNDGSGGFGVPVLHPVGDFPVALIAADFTGDGNLDLATVNTVGLQGETFSLLVNRGNGDFEPQVFSNGSATPASLASGDLDGDGDLDVAITNSAINQVGILLNEGGQLFFRNSIPVGSLPTSVAIFDVDGDADNDLVVSQLGDNNMVVITNEAAVFTVQPAISTGAKPQSIANGDFNGDGFQDLAVLNQDANQTALFINNKAGSFTKGAAFSVGASPVFVSASDINKDGLSDFVTANQGSSNISLVLSAP
jgi:hypothetical protein